jgi:S-adenosylmethionine:tRNA ribosyltransferase-isomerase
LVYESGEIQDDTFNSIREHLNNKAHLVFNETKVIPARLYFRKETGAQIEIFCLEPYQNDHAKAMAAKGKVEWVCLIGNAKKWKSGSLVNRFDGLALEVRIKEKLEKEALISFSWEPQEVSFAEVLQRIGHIPIPPYIQRKDEDLDRTRYQSVMAKNDGAVAAPTASLHFSERLVQDLEKNGVSHSKLTLHVGAGTFKPIESKDVRSHKMHSEAVKVSLKQIEALAEAVRNEKGLVCVGTTALRSLESLFWIGVQCLKNGDPGDELKQEFSYLNPSDCSFLEVLGTLKSYLEANSQDELSFRTSLMIRPGYSFKTCKVLITNFHMPRSSLLLLVAALIGDDWKKVYRHALSHQYRFLSYGDSSLLIGN